MGSGEDVRENKVEIVFLLSFFGFFSFIHLVTIIPILMNVSQFWTLQVPHLIATILHLFGISGSTYLLLKIVRVSELPEPSTIIKKKKILKIYLLSASIFSLIFWLQLPFSIVLPQNFAGISIYFRLPVFLLIIVYFVSSCLSICAGIFFNYLLFRIN
ncbi:MAG: hypothetical protein ACTSRW_06020 [Candidatus Helarchaeota archaeon]